MRRIEWLMSPLMILESPNHPGCEIGRTTQGKIVFRRHWTKYEMDESYEVKTVEEALMFVPLDWQKQLIGQMGSDEQQKRALNNLAVLKVNERLRMEGRLYESKEI
jgi:hypothetical protein